MIRAVPALPLLPFLPLLLLAPAATAADTAPLEAAPPLFEEMTAGAPAFVHVNGRRGDYQLPEITCGGAALLDYDGDGDLDVYFAQGQYLDGEPDPAVTDRLYRNRLAESGRLAFADVTGEAGLGDAGYGCGVAAGDVDADGRPDLYVTRLGPDLLLRNRGDGTFADATAAAGLAVGTPRWGTSASFADHDADGDPDLYVANYVEYDPATAKQCRTAAGARDYCNPSAYRGVPDHLFENRGDGTFRDVSRPSGIGAVRSKSLGVVAADLTGDGRVDYYVTNDGVPNQLWQQAGDGATAGNTTFQDVALLAGVAVNGEGRAEAGMGVAAADDDGDGDPDLFLTHLTGETDTLYRNGGAGFFDDATLAAGLAAPTWPFTSWGLAWADLDLDGDLDLAVVSGAVRTLEALADAGDPFPFHQRNQLFVNRLADGGGPRYEAVEPAAGDPLARSEVSRGVAAGDLDDDGDVDLVVVNSDGPARVLLNRTRERHPERPWLGVRLVRRAADGGPLLDVPGAVAELEGAEPRQVRRAAADGSYASSGDLRVLFAPAVDGGKDGSGKDVAAEGAAAAVLVTWPDGTRERFAGLAPGRYHTVEAGTGTAPPSGTAGAEVPSTADPDRPTDPEDTS